MSSDSLLDNILTTVLKEVCLRCDFVHAESFKPAGNTMMVQVRRFPAQPLFCSCAPSSCGYAPQNHTSKRRAAVWRRACCTAHSLGPTMLCVCVCVCVSLSCEASGERKQEMACTR
jgi:hypothetical protein